MKKHIIQGRLQREVETEPQRRIEVRGHVVYAEDYELITRRQAMRHMRYVEELHPSTFDLFMKHFDSFNAYDPQDKFHGTKTAKECKKQLEQHKQELHESTYWRDVLDGIREEYIYIIEIIGRLDLALRMVDVGVERIAQRDWSNSGYTAPAKIKKNGQRVVHLFNRELDEISRLTEAYRNHEIY